ncbi:hypothetical protein [Hallella bergensis]|uniref:hypothetical protein n=1 Tax=Hallella bergensis TaxID=242750 RepID=UPI0023F2F79A|nr:hypothetical protein [Hallella bergensis]
MKKGKIWLLSAVALLAGFTSCSDDDEWNTLGGGKVEMKSSARAFILNEGNMGKNNSKLFYFDWSAPTEIVQDLFNAQNGKGLGDTGNDIEVVDNNRIVLAVNVSNYVCLLDGYGIEKDRISFEQYKNLGQVRNIEEEDGIIYAVSYGGYVSRIKINGYKLQYMDSLKVGDRPEDIAEEDGKLYITLQGTDFKDNRLAIVNSDFKTVSYATIMQNPAKIYEEDGKMFIQGFGATYNYPWGIYDPKTGKYNEMGTASCLGTGDDMVYLANSQTDWVTYKTTTTLSAYNTETGKVDNAFFKKFPETLSVSSVYSISSNPYNGNVYVATTDFKTESVFYVFDKHGNFLRQFSYASPQPNKVVFLK